MPSMRPVKRSSISVAARLSSQLSLALIEPATRARDPVVGYCGCSRSAVFMYSCDNGNAL